MLDNDELYSRRFDPSDPYDYKYWTRRLERSEPAYPLKLDFNTSRKFDWMKKYTRVMLYYPEESE